MQFVYHDSFRVENAVHACTIYDDLRRIHGAENVRVGPVWLGGNSFSLSRNMIGAYLKSAVADRPTLEDALKACERKGIENCPGHQ